MEPTNNLQPTTNAMHSELIATLNYTGQYSLPELPGWLTRTAHFDTYLGTHSVYKVEDLHPKNIMHYLRDILLPFLQETQNNLSGDDDYFDYGPSLKDEALELLSGLFQGHTNHPHYQKYYQAIQEIMPDPVG